MIYPANFEAKINFNKIRHLIAANCLSEMGKELVDAIAFSTDPAVIATAQEETDEAARLHREE
ncbi:MAG: hypothetical protein LBI96_02220, partial [Odoribacteraceae bacterium]|nr:hypothetical protein [Odoribacteraceae bacterium]